LRGDISQLQDQRSLNSAARSILERESSMLTISESDSTGAELIRAIRAGELVSLKQLLDANPDLARARVVDHKGAARTLLHIASDWPGHFPNAAQSVAILAAAGAELDAAAINTSAAETALHWAASSNDVAVLDALLDAGADIEAPGAIFTGGSAMSDAVVFAQWHAARRLLERGARTEIWQAAALGQLASVQEYVRGPPAASGDQITNALWHACRGGQLAVAEYLLECGANRDWIGYDSRTPLDAARESGESGLIQWLESLGARSGRLR
jgi:uncharacterized protein